MDGAGGGGNDAKIKWMYEGPKSEINREDYLLGKKIDKNFELVSDVVRRDREEEKHQELFRGQATTGGSADSASTTGINRTYVSSVDFKESVLQTDVVRKEDPLVMLKLREEQRKRAMLENPLTQMRIKRVLKEAFEKEREKKVEGGHKRRSRSSSSSDDEVDNHSHHRRDKEEHSRHSRAEVHSRGSRRHSEEERHHHHHRHGEGKRHESCEEHQRRHQHRHSPYERRRVEGSGAGPSSSSSGARQQESEKRSSGRDRREPSKKISQEEKEQRLAAMMANAKWRDERREENIQRASEELRREVEESERRQQGAVFMKPMLNAAAGSATVEQRLQSTRAKLQRSHDYMEKSFASKKS